MKYLIDKLRSNRRLDAEEYKALLLCRDTELAAYLQELAREEALARFGNKIFIRGLIEITNRCRNNCYYCGIRKENRNIVRYELAQEEILSCCHEGYRLGFRTFVLQGGEAQAVKDEGMVETVAAIRQSFPDCAITLSLGENRGKPTNVSSWQVPTAICCGTKPATKGIITGFILLRCPFPIGCNAWTG